MSLHAGVNIERSQREGAQRRRDCRAERHVRRAEAEDLHLKGVASDFRRVEIAGPGNALAVLIDEDRPEHRIQIGITVAVFVVEGAKVDEYAVPFDAVRQVLDETAFPFGLFLADPAVMIGVGDGQGLQPHL